MAQTPIAHFSGKFRFHMPEFNNDPKGQPIPFDPHLPVAKVMDICGCDPAHYYEFGFFDARVSQITYSDGSIATDGDALIGQTVDLAGMLPDVAASAICAQLFAGRFKVGNSLQAQLRKAVQSDLRLNIRLNFGDETAGAFFATTMDAAQITQLPNSRALQAWAAVKQFEIYFHVNHYTRLDNSSAPDNARLTGDVYGFIRPSSPPDNASPVRLNKRRLVAHPDLSTNPELEAIFLKTGDDPIIRITDIDGTYDVLPQERLLTLHHLNFVPFLDGNYATPDVKCYIVTATTSQTLIELGRFSGNAAEMRTTGGLLSFRLPPELFDPAQYRLSVLVLGNDGATTPLMLETEWDLVLETDRGVTLPSKGASEVVARVYRNNRPASNQTVTLKAQNANRRSPVVAGFQSSQAVSGADGKVHCTLSACDLENLQGASDPVTAQPLNSLPWDRYAGSYVYLEIDNPLRRTNPPVEQIEIAVRVLHAVDVTALPAAPSFAKHIKPLFAYYLRYFPWLHVRKQGDGYFRFLNVEDPQVLIDNGDEILRRLSLPENDQSKMPRSRDFPVGGAALFKKWLDAGAAP